MQRVFRGLLPVVLVACISATVRAQLRMVVKSFDAAPGTANLFEFFNAPILNNNGEVAFAGFIDDEDGSSGIWSEGDGIGAMRKVALAGDPAPDTDGLNFLDLGGALRWNDLGDVAFVAFLDDPSSSQAIYTDRERPATAFTKIAQIGEPAVDTGAGRNYNSSFVLGDFGGIHSGTTFTVSLGPGDPPNNLPSQAVYNEGFNVVLDNVAEAGDDAPGTVRQSGGIAQFDRFSPPTINDAGYIAFMGETNASTGAPAMGDGGIWTTSPDGVLRAVALQGQEAPGAPNMPGTETPAKFSQIFRGTPVINNDGDIVFMSTLVGLFDGKLLEGVWVERDGVVEKVAIESEDAPGTDSKFQRMDFDPLIDGAGRTSFVATLDDGRDGLWRESSPGNLDLVAIQGGMAPETSLEFLNILDVAMNAAGQVAFQAQLSDFSSDGLFATDPAGELRKIVASGDVLDADGTLIAVEFIDFLGLTGSIQAAGNGVMSGLNDSGQVAFRAEGEMLDELLEPTGEFIEAMFVSDLATISLDLPGDYNNDDKVDAADYTVWRDALGSTTPLPNDPTPGDVDQTDYGVWVSNFGQPASASAIAATIPEPTTCALWALACAALALRRGQFVRRGLTLEL